MNKSIYICAAAAMMLASCSNDETVELAKENAISFRSIVSANTRGVVADATNLNTIKVQTYSLTMSYSKRTVLGSSTLPSPIIGLIPVN